MCAKIITTTISRLGSRRRIQPPDDARRSPTNLAGSIATMPMGGIARSRK
jgi:hypothetical protein